YALAKAAHDAAVAEATAKLRTEQQKLGPALAAWEEQAQAMLAEAAANPLKLHGLEELQIASDGGVAFAPQQDGSLLASGPNPERAVYTITGRTSVPGVGAVRLDVLPDDSLPAKGPGRVAHGNFVLTEMTVEVSASADFAEARRLEFAAAKADFEQAGRPFAAKDVIDGNEETGWAIAPQFGKPHWAMFALKEPLAAAPGPLFVRIRLSQQHGMQHTLGRFKLSLQTGVEPATALPEQVVKTLAVAPEARNDAERQQLLDYFSETAPSTKNLFAALKALKKKEPPKPELAVRVIAQRSENPRKTFVLKRGEFLEPIVEMEAAPAGFATLPPLKPRAAGGVADRLDLGRWLVASDNPLTPRVAVNHAWRLLFGAGIVRTASDFGVRGEGPTHPELLDWLAAEFIGQGSEAASGSRFPPSAAWSRKSLIKRIVMSATYRQASRHRAELIEADPQNLWLARQNRLRAEGEIVRDISLDAAGLLSRKIGGPSVFPPLPPGIAELSYAGNFKWTASTGADRYRRGMYTFFKRTAPHPNLTTFDCPDANLTCVERR